MQLNSPANKNIWTCPEFTSLLFWATNCITDDISTVIIAKWATTYQFLTYEDTERITSIPIENEIADKIAIKYPYKLYGYYWPCT